MRDTLKDKDYWDFYIQDVSEFIKEIEKDLVLKDQPYKSRITDTALIVYYRFDLTCAYYSSGAPIEECVAPARQLLIHDYPRFIDVLREQPKQAGGEAGGWDFITRYLALAVLSQLTPEESKPLVDAVDFWQRFGDRNALWEKFIAYLGHGKGREPVGKLLMAYAYEPLLDALDEEGTDLTRQAALRNFDKDWLKNMRKTTSPRYSDHDNVHNTYVGYWNFEAAAAAVMMNIDDSILEGSKTYPKDWADWARLRKMNKQ